MNLGIPIILAIIIAICIVPFILMSRNSKKRERKTLQSIINIANQQDCTITKHEICGDFIIGIDETKNFVFFFKQLNIVVEQFINLADIQNCKVKNTTSTVTNKHGNYNVIDKLELSFIPFDKKKKEITMEFFNADNSIQLVGELQSVEKWSNLINDCLKYKK